MLTVRPTRITGEPLADDYEVRSGGFTVGRIYLDRASVQPHLAWYWTINGVHAGPGIMQLQGRTPSLEDAKAALRENWNKWLAWAQLAETPAAQ
jgi:hypothetical protein